MAATPTRSSWGNCFTHYEACRTTWTLDSWARERPFDANPDFCCDWCGQRKRRMYSYGVWSSTADEKHKFCDRQCADAYYG